MPSAPGFVWLLSNSSWFLSCFLQLVQYKHEEKQSAGFCSWFCVASCFHQFLLLGGFFLKLLLLYSNTDSKQTWFCVASFLNMAPAFQCMVSFGYSSCFSARLTEIQKFGSWQNTGYFCACRSSISCSYNYTRTNS